jgi:hypothetical protein
MTIHWIAIDEYDPDQHAFPIAGEDIEPHFWVFIGDDDMIYSWTDTDQFPAGFTPTGAKAGDPICVRHDKLPGKHGMDVECYLWEYHHAITVKKGG